MKIRISFDMQFKLPPRSAWSSGDHRRVAALNKAATEMVATLGRGTPVGDRHHLTDITAAIQQLADVMKRAKASRRRPPSP